MPSDSTVPSAPSSVQVTGRVGGTLEGVTSAWICTVSATGACTTCCSALDSSAALSAVRNSPPVPSAMHCICARASGSEATSKPMTWAVNPMPAASSSRAMAQGSGLQFSIPSETRMTVAASSVKRSDCAAATTESVIGVRPRGLMAFTACKMRSRVKGAGATMVSMSEHDPRSRWP